MLKLTSHGLRSLTHKLENGPARSIAISAGAGAVGLVAGKLEDAKKTPLVAVASGVGFNLLGLHTLGDATAAGGATIIGYRFGARMGKRERHAEVIPGTPTVTPAGHRQRRRHA